MKQKQYHDEKLEKKWRRKGRGNNTSKEEEEVLSGCGEGSGGDSSVFLGV